MTLRQLAADELGMDPEDFQLVYQDTSRRAVRHGRHRLADAVQQRPRGRRRGRPGRRAAAQAWRPTTSRPPPADIVLADGHAHVAGTPDVDASRSPSSPASPSGGELLIGHGSGAPPSAPPLVGSSCVGDVGMAAFVAPQFSCHAVRVRLDRDTGVVRVLRGRRRARLGHDHQRDRRARPGRRRRDDGHRPGADRGHRATTTRSRQRNAALLEYKLQTCADAPTIHTHFVQIATPDAGPRGAKGLAEAPNVATAAAISNAIAKLRRQAGAPAADDRRAGVGGDAGLTVMNFTIATTLDEALAALAAGARPVAGGSDLVVGARQGKAPLPDVRRRHRPHRRRSATSSDADDGVAHRRARHARTPSSITPTSSTATPRSPTPARWSARRRRATSARSAAT